MDPGVLTLAFALALSAGSVAPLPVPGRDGSASGALRQAQEGGRFDVPWTVSAELDGQAEEWVPWAGLPLRTEARHAGGGSDDLSGSAGSAGPLGASFVAGESDRGFGGLEERAILAHPLPLDTPLTQVHFWRGAVNSYRFGFGLARQLIGPWSLDLRMNTRSAPGRFWEYRQQVNDMYGPRGKPQGLPFQGQGPGQDDVRWEFTGSRSLSGGRFDLGWNWVDAQRGVPHPLSNWDSLLPKSEAYTARSGVFGRLELERGAWAVEADGRSDARDWNMPAWPDSGTWRVVAGDAEVRAARARVGIGPAENRLFLEGFAESIDGGSDLLVTDSVPSGAFEESRSRFGVSAQVRRWLLLLRGGAGWNRLEPFAGSELSALDASASLRFGTDSVYARVGWNRSALLPGFEELARPDVFRPRLEAAGLSAETRDVTEARLRWAGSGLAAEAGAALLLVDGAIRPAVVPSSMSPDTVDRAAALRPVNRAGAVRGYSLDGGLHASWRWFLASSRIGYGLAGLPGEPLGGAADLSEPRWRTRSSIRWSDELLPGRFRASVAFALATWSESWIYVPTGADQAALLELPESWGLDFETRCEIRTFEIFWRMENLGHKKHSVLPGWTPLGVRAGWGVVWSFGG